MFPRAFPFGIAALIFVLDRLTKSWITAHVSPWTTHRVIPGLVNIIHAENPGIAFSLLANARGPWRNILLIALSLAVLAFVIGYLWRSARTPSTERVLRLGLAFVLGGALGNLYDRVVYGTVTDFVEVYAGAHYFPAFNVADSAITVGAVLLFADMLRGRKSSPAPAPEHSRLS